MAFKSPAVFAKAIAAVVDTRREAVSLLISQAKSSPTVPADLYADTMEAIYQLPPETWEQAQAAE